MSSEHNPDDVERDREVERIMNMSEDELRADLEKDGDTIEAAAARMQAAFERAKMIVDEKIPRQFWRMQ